MSYTVAAFSSVLSHSKLYALCHPDQQVTMVKNKKVRKAGRPGGLPRDFEKTTIGGTDKKRPREEEDTTAEKKVVVADPKCTIQFNTGNIGDYMLHGFPALEVSASSINNEDDVLRIVEKERKTPLERYNLTTTVMDIIEMRFVRTDDSGVRSVESFDMAEFRRWREVLRMTGKHHEMPCCCVSCIGGDGTSSEAHPPCIVVVFDMLGMVKKLELLLGDGVAREEGGVEDADTVVEDGTAVGKDEDVSSEEDDKEQDPDFEI